MSNAKLLWHSHRSKGNPRVYEAIVNGSSFVIVQQLDTRGYILWLGDTFLGNCPTATTAKRKALHICKALGVKL